MNDNYPFNNNGDKSPTFKHTPHSPYLSNNFAMGGAAGTLGAGKSDMSSRNFMNLYYNNSN